MMIGQGDRVGQGIWVVKVVWEVYWLGVVGVIWVVTQSGHTK